MGRIRTSIIKNAAKELDEILVGKASGSFKDNQKILKELALIKSSKVRNKIAGYMVRVFKKHE